jgi:hypothetical protein
MPSHQTYKEALQTALEYLDDAEGHAMAGVLSIAFAGVYKELGRLYEVGEILEMEPAAFNDTGDANIDLILKLVHHINLVKESIRNLNALESEVRIG